MPHATSDELRRTIEAARRYAEAQRQEAVRLHDELATVNEQLGRARRAQEHRQRPSTLLTESARQRLADWIDVVRARRNRS